MGKRQPLDTSKCLKDHSDPVAILQAILGKSTGGGWRLSQRGEEARGGLPAVEVVAVILGWLLLVVLLSLPVSPPAPSVEEERGRGEGIAGGAR